MRTLAKPLLAAAASIALAAPAAAAWQEASSKHFVVYSDDTPEHVRDYTQRLERFDSAVRAMRGLKDPPVSPSSRVAVYLVKDQDELHRVMGRSGSNVAGVYVPRSAGPISVLPKGSVGDVSSLYILFHEYTHHMTFAAWGGSVFPTWFVEGFAEFHATARTNADGSVAFGAAPGFRRTGIAEMNLVPTEQLLQGKPKAGDGRTANAFYARSWLLFHYLQFDPDRQQQFRQYISAVNSGTPYQEAGKVFGTANSLDIRMTNWAQRKTFPSLMIPASSINIGEVTVKAMAPGAAAAMPATIRSRYGVDPKTSGPAVAEMARRAAAQFPADATALNELAEAEFDVGNYSASGAAAARAIAVDPTSVHAWLYKGMALSEQLKAAKSADRAPWQQARAAFLEANKLEPEYAEPLFQFYKSFVDAGQNPSANAQSGLLYAQMLAPAAPNVRMSATKVLLQQNKPAEARKMIEPLVFSLENPKSADRAAKVLDAMTAGDQAKALALLDHAEKAEDKPDDSDTAMRAPPPS